MALLVVGLFSGSCQKQRKQHDPLVYYLHHFTPEEARQYLATHGKDDSLYTTALLNAEFNAVFMSGRPNAGRIMELDSLLEQDATPTQKGILHLLKSGERFGKDYYQSYREARTAADIFETTKDTDALFYAYRNLAYRYPTDAGMSRMGNKDDTRYYRNQYLNLIKHSKRPNHQLSYCFTLLNDDTICALPVEHYERLARQVMKLANEQGVADRYESSTRLAISAVYQRKGLQSKVDSMLEFRQRDVRPDYQYLDVFDMTRHSSVKDNPSRYADYIEKAITTYRKNHNDNPNFLVTAYGTLEKNYVLQGDYKKAYYYKGLKDSLANALDIMLAESRMANVEGEFKLKQKETEVTAARKSQMRLLVFSLITGVLAVVAGLLGYYNYRSRRRIEALYERESDIKRVISHDVLSPLASLEMLNRRLLPTIEEGKPATDIIRRQQLYIQNISALCHNLVGWLWHGKSDRPQATNLKPLLDDLLFELDGFVSSYEASITVEFEGDVAHDFVSDPNALRTVLRNLLTNSLRHGKSKTVVVRCEKVGKNIRLVLRDDGTPIDEELAETLHRLLNGKSDGKSMSGLGLYLAGKFLSALKGRYTIMPSEQPPFHNDHIVEIPAGHRPT
ncbi:MAG TPA: HAMP domain-containing sensor histidine kinase [Flavobacterium sp.]|nr:HAMP domain-containing sensor histidine kinase [Flavobacterium sp.]